MTKAPTLRTYWLCTCRDVPQNYVAGVVYPVLPPPPKIKIIAPDRRDAIRQAKAAVPSGCLYIGTLDESKDSWID